MDLSNYDQLTLTVLVPKGKKINFERAGILMLNTTEMGKRDVAIQSAEYVGEGTWMMDKHLQLKRKENVKN